MESVSLDQIDISGAAIVCGHVAAGHDILCAERSNPVAAEDSGWQFLCNSGAHEREAEAQVWSIAEVIAREPSIALFVGSAVGSKLVRDSVLDEWRVGDE
jgi:hypothetical protein